MGWRGTLRTLAAIAREAERNAQRQQRAHQRYLVAAEKAERLQQAAQAVHDYNTLVSDLVSLHKSGAAPIDWHAKAEARPPSPWKDTHVKEEHARTQLSAYKPFRISLLLGIAQRKLNRLRSAIEATRHEDEQENLTKHNEYREALSEYAEERELAQGLLSTDTETTLRVLRELNPFTVLANLGSSVTFRVIGHQRMVAELDVRGESIVPKDCITLLQSGKASIKRMPKGDYYRLYQDYVCSAVLRVARELFALLPIESVGVTAREELLNTTTGHLERQPILSVFIPRQSFGKINLNDLDPSDSMGNFLHEMNFSPNNGFRPIQALDYATIGTAAS